MTHILDLPLAPSFSAELPADKNEENSSRQVPDACFSYVKTLEPSNPKLVHFSSKLLKEIGVEVKNQEEFTAVFSGKKPYNNFKSYAMCYGGHQFGHWAGQLGDGRAINIAETEKDGKPIKFQLKGAGPTPYSRTADGLAVLRSSIREYLCSEAMSALGIPTTRAMSLATTGDFVPRDMLYNGNVQEEQGAVVCRVAPSFIRFGSFEILASRQDKENLTKLANYTIKHHYPELGEPSKETYIKFIQEVSDRTRKMILDWQRVGFVHGVMNTDNMSILGLTIDYGPYGWLEDFNPGWTPNTTDSQHRRYRFGNQASVAQWNLMQLANAFYPLIEETEPLQSILDDFQDTFTKEYHEMSCHKLGLYQTEKVTEEFTAKLEKNLTHSEIDMTLFYRELSKETPEKFWHILKATTYLKKKELKLHKKCWMSWYELYQALVDSENMDKEARSVKMNAVNPKYVLRNYMAQLAIEAAENGNYELIDELYQLLQNPYDNQPEHNKWYAKRPEWANDKVGCSMLSCSS